jgi:hypothetical protein
MILHNSSNIIYLEDHILYAKRHKTDTILAVKSGPSWATRAGQGVSPTTVCYVLQASIDMVGIELCRA